MAKRDKAKLIIELNAKNMSGREISRILYLSGKKSVILLLYRSTK